MNTTKFHIEGWKKVVDSKEPTRAVVIPLLPEDGAWAITGTVHAVRADGLFGPVTFFPQLTGSCAKGIATLNSSGTIPTQPLDGGADQRFQPGGLSLVGADGQGLQIEIAFTGVAEVATFWAWHLDIFVLTTPRSEPTPIQSSEKEPVTVPAARRAKK